MKKILWESRSSAFLYIYQYLFFIVAAAGLTYFNSMLSVAALIGLVCFIIDAKTMKYQLSEEEVYFSASLFDREAGAVSLKDIVGFYVVDEPPWNLFSLGTVLLITDVNSDEQPCIKCVKNPEKLAKLIKRNAIKHGAIIEMGFE